MSSRCTVCHKSKVPNYFLIKCISCSKFWHHRCHSPPISDPELIAIIKAFNDARARNSDATLNWKCGACRKVKPVPVDPVPKPRTASTKDDPIVVDDDEVEIIHPPVIRQKSSKTTGIVASHSTSSKVAQPVRIIDDPIDFLISPSDARPSSQVQRSTSSTTLASGIDHLSVSEKQKRDVPPEPTPPPISQDPELHSQRASMPSHEILQAQLETPENRQTSLLSSRARPRSAERGSADQPSSPTMAPALAPLSLGSLEASRINPGTKERPFLERWSMATVQFPRLGHTLPSRDPAPPFHPALLPHYINSRYRNSTSESESDKRIDAWFLAASKKSKVKDAPEQGQSTGASDPSHSRSNRKSRAVHLEANHEMVHPPNANFQSVSKIPFHFSVNTWMKQNEDALTLFEAIA